MSDKPQRENKSKKRRDSDASIRKFLTILLALLAICMTVLVIYALRNSSTDPTTADGVVSMKAIEVTEVTEAPTEAPTEEVTEETEPEDPARSKAQKTLESMTLEEKVCQMFFVTSRELTDTYYLYSAGEETRTALESKPVGGIVLDSENIFDRDQVAAMIADTQSYSKIPLLVGIEEEGGFNSYLDGIGVTGYYDQMGVYGDGYETDRVYEIGNEIGTAITGIGFNIDLAPVADTLNNVFNTEVGRRAFSTNPETTAVLVTQMVKGLHSGGCMSCLKYFPGLSVSNMDSRYGTAVSEQTLEQLQGNLLPFSTGIENGADMIMVSHLCFPNIVGENRPADLCPEIVNDLLRVQLGYDGVVMTDSFQKGAISYLYDTGDAAVAAIQAGCDMIYQPDDLTDAAQAILDAVNNGRLTEERINESVLRILALKYANGLK